MTDIIVSYFVGFFSACLISFICGMFQAFRRSLTCVAPDSIQ